MVAHRITLSRDDGSVLTDREMMLLSTEDRQQEAETLAQIQHYQTLGLALAALVCSFHDALMQDELRRLTREEVLELLKHVVQGR
jgi:hypothetical protein